MNLKEFLSNNMWIVNIIYSLLTIIIAIILYRLSNKIIIKNIEKVLKGKKIDTYFKLFKSLNKYFFILIVIFILLKINGVNITAMITGVGVIGIIFGFAIQDALKDVIKGFDILADSYYQVGDVIRVDKYTGLVLAIGIKTTRLEDIYEKNIISISNRNIEKVEVISHLTNIDIPLPYELKLKDAENTIKYIVKEIKKLDKIEDVRYHGVNNFADSSIKYQIKVYSLPIDKVQARRDALTCILRCLEEKDIHIPFNQIDVHNIQ